MSEAMGRNVRENDVLESRPGARDGWAGAFGSPHPRR